MQSFLRKSKKEREKSREEKSREVRNQSNEVLMQFALTDLWQRSSGAWALRRHGEHRSDAQANASRSSIHVDPEGHPGQDDD